MSYFLRDGDWATPLASTTTEFGYPSAGRFAINIEGRIDTGEIRFEYVMTVDGDESGRLHIATRGAALSAFRSNRVELTVLHPLECAGIGLNVRHSDGRTDDTLFPILVTPAQPLFDIAGLSYRLPGGERLEIEFRGRTPNGAAQFFEMEDQRNWGDASYKTYIGSLFDPWPFEVAEGDAFEQEIAIAVTPDRPRHAASPAPGAPALPTANGFSVPAFGVSVPLDGAAEALFNVRTHGAPSPAFVSAYLRSDRLDGAELDAIRKIAETLGAPLTVELEVNGEPARALGHAAEAMEAAGLEGRVDSGLSGALPA